MAKQCHSCPKSVTNGGTPDDECLTCNGADYLANGFRTVTPVDDISKVQKNADPAFRNDSGLEKNGELIKFSKDKTQRNLDDCEKVLGVLKNCHHTSLKHIACMVGLFLSLGTAMPMFTATLNGDNLAHYAKVENTSKQNAYQTWNRVVEENPIIRSIGIKRRKKLKLSENKKETKNRS